MACKVSLQSSLATLIAISVANSGNGSVQVVGRCIAYVRPATRIPSTLLHLVPMPAWEQRKASEVFQIVDDRGHPTLPVLSATQNQGMIYRDDSGRYIGHDESNEIGYKRVLPGDFVVHLRSFQGGFAHSQYEGITSPAYTVFRAKEPTSHSDRFWKHWFMSEHFIAGLSTVTYGIRDGRSISVDEFMNTFLAFPAVEEQAGYLPVYLIILMTSSPFISVSVYLFGKGAPCGHKHNKRRNVILRLLLAMGQRLQGRRDSGGDDEEIQTHTGVAEKAYP